MLERDLRDYFENQSHIESKALVEMNSYIFSRIKLEEGVDIKPGVQEAIFNDISRTILLTTEFLHISFPEVDLIYPWEGEPSKEYGSNEHALANAIVNKENPTGLIRFAPLYLQSVADFHKGIRYGNALRIGRISLEKTIAHESYHIWQARVFPSNFKKQIEILKAFGYKEWNKTRIETTARRYEQSFRTARIRQDSLVKTKIDP